MNFISEPDFNVIKIKALNHYDRMITYAITQNMYSLPDKNKMLKDLKENWTCLFCPFCKFVNWDCFECPISIIDNVWNCEGTPWYNMDLSNTWDEWLLYAKLMLKKIKSLDYDKYKTNKLKG